MRTMRQPPSTAVATCACAVSIVEIVDELHVSPGDTVLDEAEKLGMSLTVDWAGNPALSVADATRLVAQWRARVDAHYAEWARYTAWRDQQIRASAEAAQAKRNEDARRWAQENAKLAGAARAAAEAKQAKELEEHQRAQAEAAGVLSFERYTKTIGKKAS